MEANPHPNSPLGNSSQKKCPHCGQWTVWNLRAEDRCTHCGHLLSTHIQEKEARAERILTAPSGLFPVKESDGLLLKIGKRSLNIAHIVFTAIMSFVVWVITFVAG